MAAYSDMYLHVRCVHIRAAARTSTHTSTLIQRPREMPLNECFDYRDRVLGMTHVARLESVVLCFRFSTVAQHTTLDFPFPIS